ncbi:PEP-CTERM sorting domain-containing protein [Roseateles oligotrophus]|uniref:PEP-CTERM sorting domain-containing protein n=1 Tax=Roseateles oligotrophus TaxID=1769250 RepID=A0ABT2YJ59_9BURK|nr:PEP-CTERM sorting domain-containing protein [Roseateles oligotrophus]MCV2370104.1 PEP-CTERM sorting domain-containing protein [Roseateles oligotrophus]
MTSNFISRAIAVGAFSAFTLAVGLSSAQAATLAADGSWYEFLVNAELTPVNSPNSLDWLVGFDDPSPAHFTFTIDAGFVGSLTVLDTGISGDRFIVKNMGAAIGETSVGVDGDPLLEGSSIADFNTALANPDFSRAVYTLEAGSYDISGGLSYSVKLDGSPMNVSTGGLQLTVAAVSAVPESSTLASLLAGLSLLSLALRRKSAK